MGVRETAQARARITDASPTFIRIDIANFLKRLSRIIIGIPMGRFDFYANRATRVGWPCAMGVPVYAV